MVAHFQRLGVTDAEAIGLAATAQRDGTTLEEELASLEHVSDGVLTQVIGREFHLETVEEIDPDSLIISNQQALALLSHGKKHLLLKVQNGTGTNVLLAGAALKTLAARATLLPEAAYFRLATTSALRQTLIARVSDTMAKIATYELFAMHPSLSARTVVNAWQGWVVGVLMAVLPLILIADPMRMLVAVHAWCTFFFLFCVGLRFAALASAHPPIDAEIIPASRVELPTYSVLVAVYKEADVVGALISALRRLDWPASKLDIKLVCEYDDRDTMNAIRAARPPANIEIVEVPGVGPRTKPKALNYALQLCRGEFVVLYDAEDVPHPRQLLEAWQKFQQCDASVACLQAPLDVTNASASWISRLFAFEYAVLFRGLLPWLSAKKLVLPLGGTSNHFRREALEKVGRWDPFNVTEDADLGLRLMRCGYRTETITLPTFEAGPETARIWIPQRTRWFKGWLQTWLVHMRHPLQLYREIGLSSFIVTQILFGGMVISSLVHPVLVATLVALVLHLARDGSFSTFHSLLLALDVINITCGYVSFWLLGAKVTIKRDRRSIWRVALFTPVYWLMMSAAAWRAVLQLCRQPHLWEKTPHGAAAQKTRPGVIEEASIAV